MLSSAQLIANIPTSDIEPARNFYRDKLGLEPSSEPAPGVLMYATSEGTKFSVYETEFARQAGHTIAQWHVDDVESEERELNGKGVTFEQ